MRHCLAAVLASLPALLAAGEDGIAYVARPSSVVGIKKPSLDLDGTWQFHPQPPAGFESVDAHALASWSPIQVPGEWAMQGFEVPKGKTAAYARSFEIPPDWQRQRVILRFEAVHASASVFVNGKPVGSHEGGFVPFEMDVTGQLRPGTNVLVVAVACEGVADTLASASQYVNHALGGIHRRVSLLALPPVHARGLRVTTPLAHDFKTGEIEVAFDLANTLQVRSQSGHVAVELEDPSGRRVRLPQSRFVVPPIDSSRSRSMRFRVPLGPVQTWDPEHPRLYTLRTRILIPGQQEERLVQKVGARQIEIRGKDMLLNGRPLKLRGVCRHETDPMTGRADTARLGRKDVELFRSGNVNYIRTSHYPPTEAFLEACDELGVMVECEAALCWVQHGANQQWQSWNYLDPKFLPYMKRANLENIAFNGNHPSILFWSLANESRWSPLWEQVLQAVKAADPTRPTCFHDQSYGAFNNAGSRADIANFHYPSARDLEHHLPKEARPLLFGEFHHVNAYNRGELEADPGVRDEWGRPFKTMAEGMYRAPGMLGGAIWSGLDDLFHLPDGRSVGYGTWGIVDAWRRPKPEFWHMKKSYSPVRVLVRHLEPLPDGTLRIPVENRQLFSDLSTMSITWAVGARKGRVRAEVPPGAQGALLVRPGGPLRPGEPLELRFVDARGVEVETERLPIGPAPAPSTGAPFGEAVDVITTPEVFRLEARGILVDIDRTTGLIRQATSNGRRILEGGPFLQVLGLHSDECLPEYKPGILPLNACFPGWKARTVSNQGQAIHIEGAYAGAEGSYTLRLDKAGRLSVEYVFRVEKAVNPRQWGVVFHVPAAFDTLQWQREGFWSTYPADHIGRPVGRARALAGPEDLRTRPTQPWSQDPHPLGTPDFRSTRSKVITASLCDAAGPAFTVHGEGRQAVRAFVNGRNLGLLVAGFHTGGGEMFYAGHYRDEHRPIPAQGEIRDRVVLDLAPQDGPTATQ